MEKIKVGKVKQLLNERPEGMTFEEYKERRATQQRFLKQRLGGVFVPSPRWRDSKSCQLVNE